MAKPVKLSHYVLQSHNPHLLASWYAKLLGGEIVFKTDFLTLVTYDDEHHRIGFAPLPPSDGSTTSKREAGRPGMSHVAFGYESIETLLECFQEAKERGDHPVVSLHHGLTISLYYKDPDGNNVETFIECFQTPRAAMDYMRSPAFQKNAVGLPFDADKAIAEIRAGASPKDIMSFDHDVKIDVMKLGRQTLNALG